MCGTWRLLRFLQECSVREEHTRMHTHLVIALIYMVAEISCWMYTSERQVARLRLAFLRAVLHQDIEAFDTELTTAKVMAGATHHMSTIQDAIGEKVCTSFPRSQMNLCLHDKRISWRITVAVGSLHLLLRHLLCWCCDRHCLLLGSSFALFDGAAHDPGHRSYIHKKDGESIGVADGVLV